MLRARGSWSERLTMILQPKQPDRISCSADFHSGVTADTTAAPTVLHVRVVKGSGGGPDKTIFRSAGHLNKAEWNVAAAYIHPTNDPAVNLIRKQADRFNCRLFQITESSPISLSTVNKLADLCRSLNVRIWHAHDYKSDVMGLFVKRLFNLKLITTVHGFTRESARTRLYYHLDNLVLPHYDHVIAVSPSLMRHCVMHGVSPSRLTFIPNAVDLQEFSPQRTRAAAKATLGIPESATVIGVISRFSTEKGVDRAIRSFKILLDRHPNTQLHLIGDGPQREHLNILTDYFGLQHAVRWWGWQMNTRPLYEMMDMLLLPSYTEGSPNVVLEAMAMKVPVAATDVGGIRQLLDDGNCGMLLPHDETEWPELLHTLLMRSDMRIRMADAARQRVHRHFSFDRRMNNISDVYHRLIHTGPTAAQYSRKAA